MNFIVSIELYKISRIKRVVMVHEIIVIEFFTIVSFWLNSVINTHFYEHFYGSSLNQCYLSKEKAEGAD